MGFAIHTVGPQAPNAKLRLGKRAGSTDLARTSRTAARGRNSIQAKPFYRRKQREQSKTDEPLLLPLRPPVPIFIRIAQFRRERTRRAQRWFWFFAISAFSRGQPSLVAAVAVCYAIFAAKRNRRKDVRSGSILAQEVAEDAHRSCSAPSACSAFICG